MSTILSNIQLVSSSFSSFFHSFFFFFFILSSLFISSLHSALGGGLEKLLLGLQRCWNTMRILFFIFICFLNLFSMISKYVESHIIYSQSHVFISFFIYLLFTVEMICCGRLTRKDQVNEFVRCTLMYVQHPLKNVSQEACRGCLSDCLFVCLSDSFVRQLFSLYMTLSAVVRTCFSFHTCINK